MTDSGGVTVVLPTMGRPEVLRALESVRGQTYTEVQTVVVLDDPSRASFVRGVLDKETLIVTSGRTGGANARNVGLRAAATEFVAFLDDDDWWESDKLSAQVQELLTDGGDLSFTGTYFHEANGSVRILPNRPQEIDETVASYLVGRPGLKHGDGYIQTSSILGRTDLIQRIGWDADLPKHQDWDLVVRLAHAGSRLTYTPRPLVHVQQGSIGSVSRTSNWRASRVWLDRHKDRLSSRARGDFVATQILRAAAAALDARGLLAALRELVSHRPHLAALLVGLHGFGERGR
jgi:glycosyltransferase involved in cell wall biosynthesis